jgi:hypothetical protein
MRKSLKRNIMEKLTAIQIPLFIFSHLSLLHLEWREGKVGYSVQYFAQYIFLKWEEEGGINSGNSSILLFGLQFLLFVIS